NIVFPDANLDKAVEAAYLGIYFNGGQVCCAGSRLFVHEDIYDSFIQKFIEKSKKIKIGDPFDSDTELGPIVDKIQLDSIMNFIDDARASGATISFGGNKIDRKGYYMSPTVITNVDDSNPVVQKEVFGPVVCVLKFKTTQEVIERANNSNYGLAAAVHTTSLTTAMKVSNALDAGTVWTNCYNVFEDQMPFGGYKESGYGRDCGEYAIQEYTQVKSVLINIE
ncbi:aldehyde dehydrogenase domain-containing protein, partial [Globomyces pollinis-pini]